MLRVELSNGHTLERVPLACEACGDEGTMEREKAALGLFLTRY